MSQQMKNMSQQVHIAHSERLGISLAGISMVGLCFLWY